MYIICNICILHYKLMIVVLEVRGPHVPAGLFILEAPEENPFPCLFQLPEFSGWWSPPPSSEPAT